MLCKSLTEIDMGLSGIDRQNRDNTSLDIRSMKVNDIARQWRESVITHQVLEGSYLFLSIMFIILIIKIRETYQLEEPDSMRWERKREEVLLFDMNVFERWCARWMKDHFNNVIVTSSSRDYDRSKL